MFAEVENGIPRNAAYPLDERAGGSSENMVNFTALEVVAPNEMLRRGGWEIKHWGNRKWATVLVYLTLVLMGGRCVV